MDISSLPNYPDHPEPGSSQFDRLREPDPASRWDDFGVLIAIVMALALLVCVLVTLGVCVLPG